MIFADLGSEPKEIDSASPCGQILDPTWAEGLSVDELEGKNLPLPPLQNQMSSAEPLLRLECKVISRALALELMVSCWR